MKKGNRLLVILTVFAALVVIRAEASVQSKFIIVEFPSDLPQPAQISSVAMYLHHTGAAQAILYLEQDQGRKLAILDVTDPANIRAVGQVSLNAAAPYDFVQNLDDSAVLIHYRNHSGFAVISFKQYKQPTLAEEPEYVHPASVKAIGPDGLLLVSPTGPSSAREAQYEVLAISHPSNPTPLAIIKGVIQRADRPQTGTIFLLNGQGLTVVRCLATEQEHQMQVNQKTN